MRVKLKLHNEAYIELYLEQSALICINAIYTKTIALPPLLAILADEDQFSGRTGNNNQDAVDPRPCITLLENCFSELS